MQPSYTQPQSSSQGWVWLIVAVAVLLYGLYKYLRRTNATVAQDGPLLASSELLAAGDLQGVQQGSLGDFTYHLLTNDTNRVMVSVELGHDTGAHILAFGDQSELGDKLGLPLSKKWLVPVELEGDFPDYFKVYCSPGKQIELREFFNPETMLQFAQFCRAYDFEIFDETLFISQAQNAADPGDQHALITEVGVFLQQNAQVLKEL